MSKECQKRSNFCECRADGLVLMCFAVFTTPSLQSTARATKKLRQVIRSAAPVTQNHLSKPEDVIVLNATPLRKSATWPLTCLLDMFLVLGLLHEMHPGTPSSEPEVFLTFWRQNVFPAMAARTFSTWLLHFLLLLCDSFTAHHGNTAISIWLLQTSYNSNGRYDCCWNS